jgi:hypothetical protein
MEDDLVPWDVAQCRVPLKNQGWSALPAEAIDEDPAVTLSRIGRIAPQYNGREIFEAAYRPGYDDTRRSQSMNGFGAHAEALGFEPPPKHIALCRHR